MLCPARAAENRDFLACYRTARACPHYLDTATENSALLSEKDLAKWQTAIEEYRRL